MSYDDVLGLIVAVIFVNAVVGTLLYLFALHYFATSIKKYAPSIWGEGASVFGFGESYLSKAYRIYQHSQNKDRSLLLPAECNGPKELVASRLLYGIISMVAAMLAFALLSVRS